MSVREVCGENSVQCLITINDGAMRTLSVTNVFYGRHAAWNRGARAAAPRERR